MRAWIWAGREFTPVESIPVSDRGFRYGMSLFESLRLVRGRLLFWEEHVERLRSAAQECALACPEEAWPPARGLLSQQEEGFARLYLTAGDGAPTACGEAGRLLLLWEERSAPAAEAGAVAVSEETYHPPMGGLKTANYWPNVSALQRAQERGFAEVLLFNEHAELVSAAMANVFLVRRGEVFTPAPATGARLGVVREWVMRKLPVREKSLFVEDVRSAEEIWLTSSWRGVQRVRQVEGVSPLGIHMGDELRARYEAEVVEGKEG